MKNIVAFLLLTLSAFGYASIDPAMRHAVEALAWLFCALLLAGMLLLARRR